MRVLLFITGFLSSSVQFILLRETSCLSGESENTTAIFLAFWLVISSAGAILAKRINSINIKKLFAVFISAPLLSLALFLLSGRVLLHPGEIMSVSGIVLMLLVTLAPTAVVSTFVFVRISILRSESLRAVPGDSFGIETIGSVIAGILATTSALLFIGTFQFYFLVIVVAALASALVITNKTVSKKIFLCVAPAAVMVLLIILFPPDNIIRNFQLRNVHTTETFDTPYGNITSGFYNGEQTLYYNFHPLYYNNDETQSEEDIHYAMLQSGRHEKVLLISGGLGNHIEEIMKYKPDQVHYYEFDPGLLRIEKRNCNLSYNTKITLGNEDAFRHLTRSSENYDVIIQLTDLPLTLSINRYYSLEYFATVKKNLSQGGVFACAPLSSFNYVSGNYIKALSSIVNALKMSFRNVTVIRGNRLYIIASDSTLRTDICELVHEEQISNIYVNCDYLNDADITEKSSTLLSKVDSNVKPNSLIKPVTSWYGNKVLLEKQDDGQNFTIILVLIILVPLVRMRREALIMYSSSAALAGLGIIAIFMLQATFGNAHLLSSIVLSILFSGLATGAAMNNKLLKKTNILPAGIAVILVMTALFSGLVTEIRSFTILFSFLPLLVFSAGVLAGSYYRAVTSERAAFMTGKIYSADLAGAASGYLVTGTVLIPLTGMILAPIILSGLILLSLTLVWIQPKL